MLNPDTLNFTKLNGLIPAAIADKSTGQILMIGFMDRESLEKTIATNLVTFFSRTKNRIWTKGETSGNYLKLSEIKSDCDNDSLLIYAEPQGPTCHSGRYSCFDIEKKPSLDFLIELFDLIKDRKINLPGNSYTTELFTSGENRIIQKFGEEAVEVLIAAKNKDRNEIVNEVSDLIYHLFVMLAQEGVEFSEIAGKLEERHKR